MKFVPGSWSVMSSRLTGLLLFIFCLGLLGSSGFVYAADRTVVGELWSADN
ncbi:MAG: hypothetical protein GY780_04250 [bacterium]|nr:hypothetical protein [bacterium]